MREDDLDSTGFVPRRIVWLILLYLLPHQIEAIIAIPFFITCIDHHEKFLQTYPGHSKNPTIARLIVDIFAWILDFLLEHTPDIENDELLGITVFVGGSPLLGKLEDLDEEAKRLEDDFITATKEEQAAAREEKILSDIRGISDDISEMKREIRDLTEAVRLLIAAQQRSSS
jgi:hypothetical protein